MHRHMDASVNGTALSNLAVLGTKGYFTISEIYEDAPSMDLKTLYVPAVDGQRVIYNKRQSLKVTLEITVLVINDLSLRASAVSTLASWAQAGTGKELTLTVSNKSGKKLVCICTQAPELGSVRDYSNKIRIEFTAFTCPYWQNTSLTSENNSGTTVSYTHANNGNAIVPVDIQVVPSGTLTSLYLSVGSTFIQMSGMSTTSVLYFRHDSNGILKIMAAAADFSMYRTQASDDDLLLSVGNNALWFNSNVSCTFIISYYARWV